jgi:Domain of unknown function (DUF4262)
MFDEFDERHASILKEQLQHIDRYGWSVTGVFSAGDDPDQSAPFMYTTGLTEHAHPEFVISGLEMQTGHEVLNDIAGRVYDKAQRFAHGQRLDDLLAGCVAVLVSGRLRHDEHGIWPGFAISRYGRQRVRLLQVVWPDTHGRYPWDDGFEFESDVQPVIGRLPSVCS